MCNLSAEMRKQGVNPIEQKPLAAWLKYYEKDDRVIPLNRKIAETSRLNCIRQILAGLPADTDIKSLVNRSFADRLGIAVGAYASWKSKNKFDPVTYLKEHPIRDEEREKARILREKWEALNPSKEREAVSRPERAKPDEPEPLSPPAPQPPKPGKPAEKKTPEPSEAKTGKDPLSLAALQQHIRSLPLTDAQTRVLARIQERGAPTDFLELLNIGFRATNSPLPETNEVVARVLDKVTDRIIQAGQGKDRLLQQALHLLTLRRSELRQPEKREARGKKQDKKRGTVTF